MRKKGQDPEVKNIMLNTAEYGIPNAHKYKNVKKCSIYSLRIT